MAETAVVFMAAGMSSRFKKIKQFASITDSGVSLIQYSVDQALKTSFDRLIFIVGDKTEAGIRDLFGDRYKNTPVLYLRQEFDPETRDRPWGTGDAVSVLSRVHDCNFVIANGDDLYGERSFKIAHDGVAKGDLLIGYRLKNTMPKEGAVNRGVVQVKDGFVIGVTERLGISRSSLTEEELNSLTSTNFFGLTSETVRKIAEENSAFIEQHEGERRTESMLPVILNDLIKQKRMKLRILPTNDVCLGVTHPGDETVVLEQLATMQQCM